MKKMAEQSMSQSDASQEQVYDSTSAFFNDILYCSESNWEDDIRENYFQRLERDNFYFNAQNSYAESCTSPVLLDQDLYCEDDEISSLLAKQEQNQLYKQLETNKSLADSRREAVEWMLKVNAYYSFAALTAVLAVNYLDRFLCSFHLQTEKPWTIQLAAVACLSLAAKVEETHVPLLLDLQVEDNKYVFEAKTIQQMEILVLSTLQWKMNPITPLSFVDYISRSLGFIKNYVLRRCEAMVLSIISDYRFIFYLPSVIATATILDAINSIEPSAVAKLKSQLLAVLEIDEEKLNSCDTLVKELASRGYGRQSNKRKFRCDVGSPSGVMDVSFSCDSSNESWAVSQSSSVSSSPEPLLKKSRSTQCLSDDTAQCTSSLPR